MKSNKELIVQKDPKSPVSEVFRTLRTNIQFMNANKRLKTLLITSTFPGEGKSWVASNLAVTFAQAGNKVILIDADMRKGRQYKIFDALPRPGLSNYLSGMDLEEGEDPDISKYLQRTEVNNLLIMTAGNIPPNPSELLVSDQMNKLLKDLKSVCDIVVIDGTPCELVTDSVILSRIVDSTVIVTAHKETKKDNLEKIVRNIKNVGGNLAGVVINKMPVSIKKYNENYYYASTTASTIDPEFKKREKETKEIVNEDKKNNLDDLTDEIKKQSENFERIMKKDSHKSNNREDSKYEEKLDKKVESEEDIEKEKKMQDRTNDILNQINTYLEKEKNKDTTNNKEK
jgi:capsular exopolysaccharide synthesis family protein